MDKCKICQRNAKILYKVKNGRICESCYNKFPKAVQNSLESLKPRQLKEIMQIVKPAKTKSFASLKSLRLCTYSIIINDWEISLINIYEISVGFHPESYCDDLGSNYANGVITLKIETRKPHIIIEEPLLKRPVQYIISGASIRYLFPPELLNIVNTIQSSIKDGTCSLFRYKVQLTFKEAERRRKEIEAEKKRKEQAEKDRKAGKKEKKKSFNETYIQSDYDEALYILDIIAPFTIEELKKKRNQLIKQYHPDQINGDANKCSEINNAYDILEKYAI